MKRIIITLLVVVWLLSACVAKTEKSVDVQPETVTGTTNTEYTKEYQYHDKTLYIGDFQPIEDNFFMDIAKEYKGYTIGIYEVEKLLPYTEYTAYSKKAKGFYFPLIAEEGADNVYSTENV